MHVVLGGVTVFLMFLAIGFGATAFGKRFRLLFDRTHRGAPRVRRVDVPEAPRLQANLPTPWIGLWERINISVFLLWVVVLGDRAVADRNRARRTTQSRPSRSSEGSRGRCVMKPSVLAALAAGVAIPAFGCLPPLPTRYERCARTPGRSGPPRHLDAMGCGRVRRAGLRRSSARRARDLPQLRRRTPFRPRPLSRPSSHRSVSIRLSRLEHAAERDASRPGRRVRRSARRARYSTRSTSSACQPVRHRRCNWPCVIPRR